MKKGNLIKCISNFIIAVAIMIPVILLDMCIRSTAIGSTSNVVVKSNFFIMIASIASMYLIINNFIGVISNYRKNKNIAFSLFGSIGFAISYLAIILKDCEFVKKATFSAMDNIDVIETILFCIGYGILCIGMVANIILLFKNKEEKIAKKVIWFILFLIFMGLSIFFFVKEEMLYTYILLLLGSFIVLLATIIKQDKNEGISIAYRFFTIVNVIVMLIVGGFIGTRMINIYNKAKYVVKFENNIESRIKNSSSTDVPIIPAGNDGKYGYINTDGEKVIDFKYDWVSEPYIAYDESYQLENFYAIVKENNQYYLITNTGDTICNLSEELLQYKDVFVSDLQDNVTDVDLASSQLFIWSELKELRQYSVPDLAKYMLEDQNRVINLKYRDDKDTDAIILDPENDIKVKYEDTEDYVGYDRYMTNYNLKIYKGTELLNTIEDVIIGNFRYSNGSIPFCNIEDKTQGWVEKTGEVKKLNGEYCIKDVTDDNIIVRDYTNNISCILDKTGKMKLKAYDIHVLDFGYVVENFNNKYAFVNKSLTSATEYYDVIAQMYKNLLVFNINEDGSGYKAQLLDNTGKPVTDTKYDALGFLDIFDLDTKNDTEYIKTILEEQEEYTRLSIFEENYNEEYSENSIDTNDFVEDDAIDDESNTDDENNNLETETE